MTYAITVCAPAGAQKNLLLQNQQAKIKLGTNYPWVKIIQVCSNKGPGPLQRGHNHKNV
jgi:hypothetical protein